MRNWSARMYIGENYCVRIQTFRRSSRKSDTEMHEVRSRKVAKQVDNQALH